MEALCDDTLFGVDPGEVVLALRRRLHGAPEGREGRCAQGDDDFGQRIGARALNVTRECDCRER